MDTLSRARAYVSKMEPSIQGSNGSAACYAVASALVHGFALSQGEALTLLREYNQTCQPQWSEKELAHKLKDAETKPHDKPRGYLLGSGENTQRPAGDEPRFRYITRRGIISREMDAEAIPQPLEDGCRKIIREAFKPGDFIALAGGTFQQESGRTIPDGKGTTKTREDWLKWWDERNGDPNRSWSEDGDPGGYIRINPVKSGGSKDLDVTAFRHVLVEFDKVPREEQWRIIKQSGVPCSAIIDSGGKSIHAWVIVDAQNLEEYRERAQVLLRYFGQYGMDPLTTNPSRFSRLPEMRRQGKVQKLLSLRTGADSWQTWRNKIEVASIGERIDMDELFAFDPKNDPNDTIGRRWLCRRGSVMFVGPSGVGKSVLTIQAMVSWALGRPLFGVTPKGPMRSLLIQAENDLGDMAEALQGVCNAMGLTDEDRQTLKRNLVIIRDSVHTGDDFIEAARLLILEHKPDLVWIDPLLSFIGDDISSQAVCGKFLRNGLNPISEETGVIWCVIHHTNKPPSDRRGKAPAGGAYSGTGSAELTNWVRATVTLVELEDEGTFELVFDKRGSRAWATHPDDTVTKRVFLAHSKRGSCWEQLTPPDGWDKPQKDRPKTKAPTKLEKLLACGLGRFLDACRPEGEGLREIARRLEDFAATKAIDAKKTLCQDAIAELVARRVIEKRDSRYFKGSNQVAGEEEYHPQNDPDLSEVF